MLPLYESIINSIISLTKVNSEEKKIEIFIERKTLVEKPDLFGKNMSVIKNITIVDNGEGFTKSNFESFCTPYSPINKTYGCKGIGRFTILAMFREIRVVSTYQEEGKWWQRKFRFNTTQEIFEVSNAPLEGDRILQTKISLIDCYNQELREATAINADIIAKGIMEHCFIYYLCNTLPSINIVEKSEGDTNNISLNVLDYFKRESKDKEKDIVVGEETFHLYVIKSGKTTSRKNNYVTLCANSRAVGAKRNMADYDSLYAYPINEDGEAKFLDIYVVSEH